METNSVNTTRTAFNDLPIILAVLLFFCFRTYGQSEVWPKVISEVWPKANHESERLLKKYPDSIDLSIYLPKVGDQGGGDCCSAFAAVWVMKSIMDNLERNISNRDSVFRDNYKQFVYNPIVVYGDIIRSNEKLCGSPVSFLDCLQEIQKNGVLNLNEIGMRNIGNPCICNIDVPDSMRQLARGRRISSFNFNNSISNESLIKQLSMGYPIGVEFRYPAGFEAIGYDKQWNHVLNLKSAKFTDGFHSVVIVGYNIKKRTFKIANSYGSAWGENGYFYWDFDFFSKLDKDAFGSSRTIFTSFYFLQNDIKNVRHDLAMLHSYPYSFNEKIISDGRERMIPIAKNEIAFYGSYKIGCFDLDSSEALITISDNAMNKILLHQPLNKNQGISIVYDNSYLDIKLKNIYRSKVYADKFVLVLSIKVESASSKTKPGQFSEFQIY